jgi:deoxyribonuclease V
MAVLLSLPTNVKHTLPAPYGAGSSKVEHPASRKSMQTKKLHDWDLSYQQAIALQQRLRGKVEQVALESRPKIVAGLDCALSKDGQRIIAAAVVLRTAPAENSLWGDYREGGGVSHPPKESLRTVDFEIIETTDAVEKISFPYIPGLLSFRESPACLAAVEKLISEPDVFIIDGQGIAHPRRFGIASHLGLLFDKPTIGCAKSLLVGTFDEPATEKGAYSLLKDKQEVIGAVVRTRSNVESVYVSIGNKCLLQDAIGITLAYTTKYRIPEPTRLARIFH